MLVVGMGEKKTPKPFIASCNQFKYLDVLAESEKKSLEEDEKQIKIDLHSTQNKNEIESENSNIKLIKSTVSQDKSDNVKNMTDLSTIKMAIIKMMNEIDVEDQSMNMGELGNRLARRYPDFDVRNYGDTKLSKFLKKFDFLEIHTKGQEGTSMWVSIKQNPDEQTDSKNTNTQKRKKRTYKKK